MVVEMTECARYLWPSMQFVAVLGFLSKHTDFARLIKSSFEGCGAQNDGVLTQLEVDLLV